MFKQIEKKIESFVRAELAGVHRIDFVHGTLYLTLDKPNLCDFIHKDMKTTPDKKFESGKLERLREQDFSVKNDPKDKLFE